MLLKKIGDDLFFCLLAQRSMTRARIVESQMATKSLVNKRNLWIFDEPGSSTVSGKPIPLDQEFYCFGSKVGLVVQIDRNISPFVEADHGLVGRPAAPVAAPTGLPPPARRGDAEVYGILASAVLNGPKRAAQRMRETFGAQPGAAHSACADSWQRISQLLDARVAEAHRSNLRLLDIAAPPAL